MLQLHIKFKIVFTHFYVAFLYVTPIQPTRLQFLKFSGLSRECKPNVEILSHILRYIITRLPNSHRFAILISISHSVYDLSFVVGSLNNSFLYQGTRNACVFPNCLLNRAWTNSFLDLLLFLLWLIHFYLYNLFLFQMEYLWASNLDYGMAVTSSHVLHFKLLHEISNLGACSLLFLSSRQCYMDHPMYHFSHSLGNAKQSCKHFCSSVHLFNCEILINFSKKNEGSCLVSYLMDCTSILGILNHLL